jgi:hypothetical protein
MSKSQKKTSLKKTDEGSSYIVGKPAAGGFALARAGRPAPIWTDPTDHAGVIRAVGDLKADLGRVTGTEAPVLFVYQPAPSLHETIIVGTLGKNWIIDTLARQKKIDAAHLHGKWETFLIQVVDAPFPGLERALVIAGSDRRGTIFGVYDLSMRIGVSPWYWWADVPVCRKTDLFVRPGVHMEGEPKVRYRGIFLNDEAPALTEWAKEKFGGLNHAFYEKVFELILRLKGNFLWPAMWGKAFYDDDPENPKKAHEYGVVIGTSHHEPCLRAHDEWRRFGQGPWNYEKNEEVLREFWREGVRRMDSYESLVTVGMRGDGDEPMSDESNIALLQRIVADQRAIIGEVTGKDPAAVPQVWAVYKEVQEYYDKGMQVPEDVTLMLCDDNWGNVRRVPRPENRGRAGGFGMYYHFDYVGGPRNYKWLNTSPIARTWEQMRLAYDTGIDRVWIVNVGDLKPLEYPISFFLDFAWDPDRWPAERLSEYARRWAERIFGSKYAAKIASFLTRYTKYNSRRKPELLSPDTYSLVNYREAETVVADYNGLLAEAEKLKDKLGADYGDAYYQLVLHPIQACANLNELYVTVAKNRLAAAQGRAETNGLAARARELFARDQEISDFYNHALAGGKWNHFMDQTHIGYTSWQQPEANAMPEVREIEVPEAADMGIAVEGDEGFWPAETGLRLPEFDVYNRREYFIEVFNRGRAPFEYEAKADEPWVKINPRQGTVETGLRLSVKIDWNRAPAGRAEARIVLAGPKGAAIVSVPLHNPKTPRPETVKGFVEGNGCVSMEAAHFARAVDRKPFVWRVIPDLGRTLSGVAAFPVTERGVAPSAAGPRLEYRLRLFSAGRLQVRVYAAPSLDFRNAGGLRYAVSFDDDEPRTVNLHAGENMAAWERSVADCIRVGISEHDLPKAGAHVLKLWLVDTGVVVEKIVVEAGGERPCYLGPPESFFRA